MTAEETRRARHTLKHDDWRGETTCGACGRSWCEDCDGTHGPLCHWCEGRGYSIAPIRLRRQR